MPFPKTRKSRGVAKVTVMFLLKYSSSLLFCCFIIFLSFCSFLPPRLCVCTIYTICTVPGSRLTFDRGSSSSPFVLYIGFRPDVAACGKVGASLSDWGPVFIWCKNAFVGTCLIILNSLFRAHLLVVCCSKSIAPSVIS